MSFLVLHMDKFKKEAVRGIQSHNRRERESHSNPDIDYARSQGNYELHKKAAKDYTQAIQNRIDDLLLIKAVRKDAVHMCGLIVSSDSVFFQNLSSEDTRRFFEESKAFLTEFVGAENVISAMVHLDEKTPHMHFLHVPVTRDGRLNANKIYTRESLKTLQTELPQYLQSRGFDVQRGVEQEPGAAKKHLDTREFKQQQEAVAQIIQESNERIQNMSFAVQELESRKEALEDRIQQYERQAQEAEQVIREQAVLPQAGIFNYRSVLEQAALIIVELKKALATKKLIKEQNERLQREADTLGKKLAHLNAEHTALKQQSMRDRQNLEARLARVKAVTAGYREFLLQPEIHPLHNAFVERKRAEQLQQRHEAELRRLQQQDAREPKRPLESGSRGMRMR
ncbi:MAG: plasmid recombination protein [Desulfovibrio sp.]|jgi:hypothetical protein|nr:plasmid recombination protein [Desulfovibrio sp.]